MGTPEQIESKSAFLIGQQVYWVGPQDQEAQDRMIQPWRTRRDDKHLCFVLDAVESSDGYLSVWDTVEKTNLSVRAKHLRPAVEPKHFPIDDLYQTSSRESYDRNLSEIADALRRLADRVEREGRVPPNKQDLGDFYPEKARAVLHEITWGVANLNLERLFTWASEVVQADRIAREGKDS